MKKITRTIAIIAIFLIPIFPLIPMPFWPFNFTDSFFFPFITGKAFYFRTLVEIAFAAWAILAFLDAKYRPRVNALMIGVTVFALIAFVADLLGVNPLRSMWSNFERMEGWITIFHLWLLYMVTTSMFGGELGKNGTVAEGNFESKKWWHRFMNMSLTIGFIVGIYGFVQLFGWAAIHQGSTRIDASLGNAAYMAVYMLINAGMAAYLFFVQKSKLKSQFSKNEPGKYWLNMNFLSWVYLILSVMFSFLLFETATRGTTLGLIGGILLALFLYAVLAKNESKKSRHMSVYAIILIILLGLGLWFARNTDYVKNHDVLNRLANISWSEAQGQARNYIWPMAVTGWSERPILGWGQENFNYIFNANYNPHMWNQEQWFDRAHSVFLDWLVAGGIVGLLAYLSLYFLLFRAIWRSDLDITQKSALTGLVAGYFIHNIFVFDNLASYVGFFTILAFAGSALVEKPKFALRQGYEGQIEGQANNKEARRSNIIGGMAEISPEIIEYVVTPISILILVAGLYFFNGRVIVANTRLIDALRSCGSGNPDVSSFEKVFATGAYISFQETREQLLSCSNSILTSRQIPDATKQAFFAEIVKGINDQTNSAPKDARMYVLGGQYMNSLGQKDLAMTLLTKAHALSPNKQTVDFSLADAYFGAGNAAQALVLLKQAYDADTRYPAAQASYAYGLIISKQEDLAKKLFNNDPTIFNTEQAASLYASIKQYGTAITIYKDLVSKNPTDANLKLHLAQIQYLAGMKADSIATLRSIEKDHTEYKDQIEATIKAIQ